MNSTKETVNIKVLDIVSSTTSNSDGFQVFLIIDNLIVRGNNVSLSFKDSPAVASSFLNSSIGELIEKHGYQSVKNRLKMTGFSKSNADTVKRYLQLFNTKLNN
jgi:hypothetical protein